MIDKAALKTTAPNPERKQMDCPNVSEAEASILRPKAAQLSRQDRINQQTLARYEHLTALARRYICKRTALVQFSSLSVQ